MDKEDVNRYPTVSLDEIRSFEMISFSPCKIQSLIMQLYGQSFKKPCTVKKYTCMWKTSLNIVKTCRVLCTNFKY